MVAAPSPKDTRLCPRRGSPAARGPWCPHLRCQRQPWLASHGHGPHTLEVFPPVMGSVARQSDLIRETNGNRRG